jgi:hypothetical protein
MAKAKPDKQREQRIQQEIVVDAHDAQEQAMGWYYYLEEQLRFPFRAKSIAVSPSGRSRPYAKARRWQSWAWLPQKNVIAKCSLRCHGNIEL